MGAKPVLSFSHVGIWVTDLETMKDTLTTREGVLGLPLSSLAFVITFEVEGRS